MPDENKTGEMPASEQAGEQPAATVESLQAELERVQKALHDANKEAASRRKKLDEFEQAEQKRKEAEMTELEKAQAALKEKETELSQLRRREMQRAAAEKAGLPLALASRLTGETPDELEADAKSLLEAMPKAAAPQKPAIGPTNPGSSATGMTEDQRRVELFGGGARVFDPNHSRQHGGGVVYLGSDAD